MSDDRPDLPRRQSGEPASPSVDPQAEPALRGNTLGHALAEHPLGAVIGAIGGLAIGGLIGLAAGPVGSLAGAVVGLVVGVLLATGFPGATDLRRPR
jgi:predicted lipid-binding transport protein (Tim44 family)